MKDTNPTTTTTTQDAPRPRRRHWRSFLTGGLAAAGLFAAAGLLSPSWAGPGFGPRMGHRAQFGLRGPATPELVGQRADRMVGVVSTMVEATPAQEQELRALVEKGVGELMSLRPDREEHRARLHELLSSETVDREALEALRAEHVERLDEVSQRLVDLVAELAEVLTPEQRVRLIELGEALHR
ncbi:MAG: Spy/CpxP family protein refolding chaperone [Acidobacteriota bacterium]